MVAHEPATGLVRVETPLGPLLATATTDGPTSGAVDVCFRPERVRFVPDEAAVNVIRARVAGLTYLGSRRIVRLVTEAGATIVADQPNSDANSVIVEGTEVTASIRPEDCRLLTG